MYAYEQLQKEPEANNTFKNIIFTNSCSIKFVKERWDKGIRLILQWMDEVETVTAQSFTYLLAYFQKSDFAERTNMEEAIRLAEEEGYRPKEGWYVLLAACFSEQDKKIISAQYALEHIGIYEILVNYYPKKLYFQLGGTYQQIR